MHLLLLILIPLQVNLIQAQDNRFQPILDQTHHQVKVHLVHLHQLTVVQIQVLDNRILPILDQTHHQVKALLDHLLQLIVALIQTQVDSQVPQTLDQVIPLLTIQILVTQTLLLLTLDQVVQHPTQENQSLPN